MLAQTESFRSTSAQEYKETGKAFIYVSDFRVSPAAKGCF